MAPVNAPGPRTPNPKPLLVVLIGVAFLGNTLALTRALSPVPVVPSQEQIAKALAPVVPAGETSKRLVAALTPIFEEEVRVFIRYRPYADAFAFLLAAVYSFVFVFGLRAFVFAPGGAKPVSFVALLVLPVRVAVAAVDVAQVRALQPAAKALALSVSELAAHDVPAEDAQALIQMAGNAAPWVLGALALLVCALFHFAWRYFQRPDVTQYFENRGGTPPVTP